MPDLFTRWISSFQLVYFDVCDLNAYARASAMLRNVFPHVRYLIKVKGKRFDKKVAGSFQIFHPICTIDLRFGDVQDVLIVREPMRLDIKFIE